MSIAALLVAFGLASSSSSSSSHQEIPTACVAWMDDLEFNIIPFSTKNKNIRYTTIKQ